MTALTPGRAAALLVSMRVMRAWAWGLRSTLPTSMRDRATSAPNCARPVTLSRASTFGVLRPMTRNVRRLRDMSMLVQSCLKGHSKQGDSLVKSLLKSREIFPHCCQRCCQTDRCACAVRKMATSGRLVVVTYQVETSGHECSETVKYSEWSQHDVYRITCAASVNWT